MVTMNEYQDSAAKTAIYPKESGLAYTTLGLAGEAGEIANKVKKIIRDNPADITAAKDAIVDELGDVLWYVAMVARECSASLGDVANSNLKKLNSRKVRGVLGGSGDNR